MKPDVQMYFMDIKDVCKNVMKQVQQVQQVSMELSKTPFFMQQLNLLV